MFLAAFLLAVGTAGLSAQTTTETEEEDRSSLEGSIRVDAGDLEALAKIDSEEAKERALTALRSATVEEVELEIEDGYLVYDVELSLGTKELELELVIDAGDAFSASWMHASRSLASAVLIQRPTAFQKSSLTSWLQAARAARAVSEQALPPLIPPGQCPPGRRLERARSREQQ